MRLTFQICFSLLKYEQFIWHFQKTQIFKYKILCKTEKLCQITIYWLWQYIKQIHLLIVDVDWKYFLTLLIYLPYCNKWIMTLKKKAQISLSWIKLWLFLNYKMIIFDITVIIYILIFGIISLFCKQFCNWKFVFCWQCHMNWSYLSKLKQIRRVILYL